LVNDKRETATGEIVDIVAQGKKEEGELGEVIRSEDRKLQRRHSKATQDCNFGPSFSLAFNERIVWIWIQTRYQSRD
jgi:hypothetical protein